MGKRKHFNTAGGLSVQIPPDRAYTAVQGCSINYWGGEGQTLFCLKGEDKFNKSVLRWSGQTFTCLRGEGLITDVLRVEKTAWMNMPRAVGVLSQAYGNGISLSCMHTYTWESQTGGPASQEAFARGADLS